jgi:hypothetical protein
VVGAGERSGLGDDVEGQGQVEEPLVGRVVVAGGVGDRAERPAAWAVDLQHVVDGLQHEPVADAQALVGGSMLNWLPLLAKRWSKKFRPSNDRSSPGLDPATGLGVTLGTVSSAAASAARSWAVILALGRCDRLCWTVR